MVSAVGNTNTDISGFFASQSGKKTNSSADAQNKAFSLSSGTTEDIAEEGSVESIIETYLDNYAKTYDKDAESEEDIEARVKSVIDLADSDKSGAISKEELKAMDKSGLSSKVKNMVTDLLSNFNQYDTNGDGELSLGEMKSAVMQNQYSMQELGAMAKDNEERASNPSSLGSMPDLFVQNILKNYENIASESVKSSFANVLV